MPRTTSVGGSKVQRGSVPSDVHDVKIKKRTSPARQERRHDTYGKARRQPLQLGDTSSRTRHESTLQLLPPSSNQPPVPLGRLAADIQREPKGKYAKKMTKDDAQAVVQSQKNTASALQGRENYWRSSIPGVKRAAPNLQQADFRVLKAADGGKTNCLGCALGRNDNRWVKGHSTIQNFDNYFAKRDYERIAHLPPEHDFRKVIVAYGEKGDDGQPRLTHFARQNSTGKWESKLGDLDLIEHSKLKDVAGGDFGAPLAFYVKR